MGVGRSSNNEVQTRNCTPAVSSSGSSTPLRSRGKRAAGHQMGQIHGLDGSPEFDFYQTNQTAQPQTGMMGPNPNPNPPVLPSEVKNTKADLS